MPIVEMIFFKMENSVNLNLLNCFVKYEISKLETLAKVKMAAYILTCDQVIKVQLC